MSSVLDFLVSDKVSDFDLNFRFRYWYSLNCKILKEVCSYENRVKIIKNDAFFAKKHYIFMAKKVNYKLIYSVFVSLQ